MLLVGAAEMSDAAGAVDGSGVVGAVGVVCPPANANVCGVAAGIGDVDVGWISIPRITFARGHGPGGAQLFEDGLYSSQHIRKSRIILGDNRLGIGLPYGV